MDKQFEELKNALFRWGTEYIEDFLGYELDHGESRDVIERRMDMAYEQMPDDVLRQFYDKFKICADDRQPLDNLVQAASDRSVNAKPTPIFLFEENRSGVRMGKPSDSKNAYYNHWYEFYTLDSSDTCRHVGGTLRFSDSVLPLPDGGLERSNFINEFWKKEGYPGLIVLSMEYSNKDLLGRMMDALRIYRETHQCVMKLPALGEKNTSRESTVER